MIIEVPMKVHLGSILEEMVSLIGGKTVSIRFASYMVGSEQAVFLLTMEIEAISWTATWLATRFEITRIKPLVNLRGLVMCAF